MADRQVIRQDVVEISWDIEDDPMKELIDMMKKFKKIGKDAQGNVGKGWNTVVSGANKVKSSLTPLHNALKKLGTTAIDVGKKFAKGIGNAAKKAAAVAKTAIKGLMASFTALAGLGALSIKNYAEYEQLVGGVETLFGKHSKGVLKYANEAYKTAGLSANEYMSTVTSFSASLLSSLGGDTKIASVIANQAIIDMSDNANKMGSDMATIQNAYQGFAKQNYTMLDNLKLGYGGTKEEMQRLLKDANAINKKNGKNTKYTISSFSDIINAIHVIQDEMGITGTTSKEASSTIQGSISAMKGAWTNFLTGMADPTQDFDALCDNLINSIITVGENLIPVIVRLAPRLGQGLVVLGKALWPYIPPMFKNLVQKAKELAPVIGQAISNLALKAKEYLIANKGAIWEGFKEVMAQGINLIAQLFTGEGVDMEAIKTKIEDIKNKAIELVNAFKENWPTIKNAIKGVLIVVGLLEGAFMACNAIIGINNAIMTVKKAIDIAVAAKTAVATAAQWAFNTSIMGCPVFWIIAAIVALIAIIVLLVKNWDKVKAAGEKCWEAIKKAWGKASEWLDTKVMQPIKDAFQGAWDFVTDLWGGITDFFSGLWDGIKNIVSKITGKAKEAKGDADTVKKNGPRKYASGGLITKPHLGLVGEDGPEMVIPLTKRNRGLALWAKAGKMLGAQTAPAKTAPSYAPGTTTSNVSSSVYETNTYSPSFTLNFTGTTDRAAERIIKQWVKDALNDTFDSMGRTSPRLTEV